MVVTGWAPLLGRTRRNIERGGGRSIARACEWERVVYLLEDSYVAFIFPTCATVPPMRMAQSSRRANTSSGQRRCELRQSALPHPLTSPTSKLVHNVDHSANYPYGNKSSESAKSRTASTPKPQRRIRKRKSQTNPHNVPTAPPPIQNLTHRNPDKTHSTGARIPEKQTIFKPAT